MSKRQKKLARDEWNVKRPLLNAARDKRNLHYVPENEIETYRSTIADAREKIKTPASPQMPLTRLTKEAKRNLTNKEQKQFQK